MSVNPCWVPYACDPAQTRGRRFFEVAAPTRSEYQRDRDRIVHSSAFRRLVYKTQVFLNHEGDLFRTRLTHSLEVAQLGRSIARSLDLNEDLVEAIALAHDLGHTPFGHAGQDALDECLRQHNPDSSGFEHNLQSLRVVDSLEERYPSYNGLNLTFETREGILKHCSPSLEAQLANLADEVAYNAHDIDDGVRSGLLTMDQLQEVALFRQYTREALAQHPGLNGRRLLFEAIRLMLSAQVYDVMDATRAALAKAEPQDVDTVRKQPPLVCFTPAMAAQSADLKKFLFHNLYRHPQVLEKMQQAGQIVRDLFAAYIADPTLMPQAHTDRFDGNDLPHSPNARPERVVADYIAGMTDRFAMKEYDRL